MVLLSPSVETVGVSCMQDFLFDILITFISSSPVYSPLIPDCALQGADVPISQHSPATMDGFRKKSYSLKKIYLESKLTNYATIFCISNYLFLANFELGWWIPKFVWIWMKCLFVFTLI